jgi:hypothetical protein
MKLVVNNEMHLFIANQVMTNDVYLAWGNSTGITNPWTNQPPDISPDITELNNEVCRRLVVEKNYIERNNYGEIDVDGIKFSLSNVPTKTILLKCRNLSSDVPDEVISQIGVYVGTKVKPEVVAPYFLTPDQITDKGFLLVSANISPIVRNEATAENRDII